MITNYFKTAIRILFRQKSYSAINIGGLAIGMSVCILILTYVFHEISFDKFHEKSENIYRVGVDAEIGGKVMNLVMSSAPMGPTLAKDYPEVIAATRINPSNDNILVEVGEKKFYQDRLLYADTSFFDVFSFKLLRGEKDKVLSANKSVVLTEGIAHKFFGKEDPVGKTIKLRGETNYLITGIIEDAPANSHINFEVIISMDIEDPNSPFAQLNQFGAISLYNYILLDPGADYKQLESKFADFKMQHMKALVDMGVNFDMFLQPLESIHLHSNLEGEIESNGDISYVYLFSAIALFILFIACINYMNLASARSFKRAKEVGMRKIHGAIRGQLIRQFLGESLLFSFIAFIISFIIVQIVMPAFNNLLYTRGGIDISANLQFILLVFVGVSFFVGILAGSYPAFYMSSFSPISALKGEKIKGKSKSMLRNILVILQFSIAVVLIVCTAVIYNQLNYMKTKDLGFSKDNRIVIPLRDQSLRNKLTAFKSEFQTLSLVEGVSLATGAPALNLRGSGYFPEGSDATTPIIFYNFSVDDQYLDVFDMEIVEGRNFSTDYGTDSLSVLVNQELCKSMGWDEPIGKTISIPINREGGQLDLKVIGIVKDFHFRSLLSKVEPFLFHYSPDQGNYLILEIKDGFYKEAIAQIEKKWGELANNIPFDYESIKENYERQYASYMRMGKLFTVFTLIAIFVACIGLFGLASFLTELRTKEIGIRKVNGAGIFAILKLLNVDFLKWVLVANIIAWPVAYYFMTKWLENFSYQVKLDWTYFALGALLSVFVALITVSYQSIKSATQNPVDCLRYE